MSESKTKPKIACLALCLILGALVGVGARYAVLDSRGKDVFYRYKAEIEASITLAIEKADPKIQAAWLEAASKNPSFTGQSMLAKASPERSGGTTNAGRYWRWWITSRGLPPEGDLASSVLVGHRAADVTLVLTRPFASERVRVELIVHPAPSNAPLVKALREALTTTGIEFEVKQGPRSDPDAAR